MTNDELAALDRAATQGVPVTGNDWLRQFSEDQQLADVLLALYRANQLVMIGPDAVEALKYADGVLEADMFDAMEHGDADWEGQARHSLDAIRVALAALGVK